jgi:hypothetical protein
MRRLHGIAGKKDRHGKEFGFLSLRERRPKGKQGVCIALLVHSL